MSTQLTEPIGAAAIWGRLLRSEEGDMPSEAARFFLNLHFPQKDLDRMGDLAVKNQDGMLTPGRLASRREET